MNVQNFLLKIGKSFPCQCLLQLVGGLILLGGGLAWAADYPTNFSNTGSIANTRHNMTQSTAGVGAAMTTVRNNYGEVCVYCHTPHGANSNVAAPLWNRTSKNNTYQTYSQLGTSTLTSEVAQPGPASMTCLSCHDGTVAIDSIINMPGSGNYNAASVTNHNETFLDSWKNLPGNSTKGSNKHYAIGETSPNESAGCMVCHSGPGGFEVATDFSVFNIGTDLRNDHPIGVNLPTSRIGNDFVGPDKQQDLMAFYDKDSDNRPDTNEVRYYKSSGQYRVECASCHDPHGVVGQNGTFNPSFLRVSNTNGSTLCLTCHNK
ncbi:MAG: cytochrome c3 family protein [Magnetococcus sp. DMHC-1]|nr:cytochrome c3 family protein [Magnetococcales bacterium]